MAWKKQKLPGLALYVDYGRGDNGYKSRPGLKAAWQGMARHGEASRPCTPATLWRCASHKPRTQTLTRAHTLVRDPHTDAHSHTRTDNLRWERKHRGNISISVRNGPGPAAGRTAAGSNPLLGGLDAHLPHTYTRTHIRQVASSTHTHTSVRTIRSHTR